MKFKHMFSPIQIGPMTVKNRFVVPPMGNNFAKTDGTWSDESVAYYAERAKGQFGLITIEATVVHKGAKGGPRKPCLYDDNSIESKSARPVLDNVQIFRREKYKIHNSEKFACFPDRHLIDGNPFLRVWRYR